MLVATWLKIQVCLAAHGCGWQCSEAQKLNQSFAGCLWHTRHCKMCCRHSVCWQHNLIHRTSTNATASYTLMCIFEQWNQKEAWLNIR